MKHCRTIALGIAGAILGTGCASPPRSGEGGAEREMLALLMPSRIEIVEPFTRVKSFDDDATPDGIEVLLQSVNSLGNPGIMIAGQVRLELYEHLAGSADQKGRRLEQWDVELVTARQQRMYWNTLTQMYEVRLGIDTSRIPVADKYVLTVVYTSPLGERLTDECLLRLRAGANPSGAVSASGG